LPPQPLPSTEHHYGCSPKPQHYGTPTSSGRYNGRQCVESGIS